MTPEQFENVNLIGATALSAAFGLASSERFKYGKSLKEHFVTQTRNKLPYWLLRALFFFTAALCLLILALD